MFSQPAIVQRFEKMVLAKLYTDRGTPEDERNKKLQQDQFETVALPFYAVVDPTGATLAELGGKASTQEFAEFLDTALRKWGTRNSTSPAPESIGLIEGDPPAAD